MDDSNKLCLTVDMAGLAYLWKKDGVPLPGATHSSLMIRAAENVDAATRVSF